MVDGAAEQDPILNSPWAQVSPEVRASNLEWATTEGYDDTASNIMAVNEALGANTVPPHNPYRGLSLVQLADHLDYAEEQGDHTTSSQIKAVQAELSKDVAHLGVTAEDIQTERAKARELGMPIPEADIDVALSIFKARRQ